MKILALDTSSNACSVSLLQGTQSDYSHISRFEMAPRQHTQLILPMIDSVLDEAAYKIQQIDVLAFGRGPGAFTGVRVATGVVQAIAYGADLPVAQISSLAAIAQGFYRVNGAQVDKVLLANDARMDEVYTAAYELENGFMTLKGQEQVLKPESLIASLPPEVVLNEQWHTVGSGWSVYATQLKDLASRCHLPADPDCNYEQFSYPDAQDIAFLALKEVSNKTLVRPEAVSPVYLRDNVAKKPQRK